MHREIGENAIFTIDKREFPRGRGVSLYLHVYIHLYTYTVYTYILEAYTMYCTGHMLSKQCNEESFLWMARL